MSNVEAEARTCERMGNLVSYAAIGSLAVGVATAAMDTKVRGFAPLHWLLLAIFGLQIANMTEIVRVRLQLRGAEVGGQLRGSGPPARPAPAAA